MEIELLNQDIQNYLNKYTRFMSKKMYITKKMYDNFVNSYEYIYDSANNSIINYDNDKYYNKLLEIKDKGGYALKIHNKKYLDYLYDKYGDVLSNKLSKKEKLAILCEEDMLVMEARSLDNKIDIVRGKISYLKDFLGLNSKSIGIVANDDIKNKLIDIDVDIFNFYELGKFFVGDEKKNIEDVDRYHILSSYIKNILYLDKKKFKKFCEVFRDKLYFDDDILDFETFNDYHSYRFKRKLRDSKKSISDFVKELIIERRYDLRSISSYVYDDLVLVDIDNTLFCSGVNYKYNKDDNSFLIYNGDICYRVIYTSLDTDISVDSDDIIYLKSCYNDGTNACEHLIYELVKRRYPIEKRGYEELYDILKWDMIDEYFSKFINDIVIPYLDVISRNGYEYLEVVAIYNELDGNLKDQFGILLEFYKYYIGYLEESSLIDNEMFIKMVRERISSLSYKYLIVLDDDFNKIMVDDIRFKLFVIRDKKMFPYSYLMSNVKLFCDFKKYINYKKLIPIMDVYYNDREIENIAYEFTSINLDLICNAYGDAITKKKEVEVYIYDDNDYLNSSVNCNYLLNKVIGNINISASKKIMLMGRDVRDKKYLTIGGYFRFNSKNSLVCNEFNDKYLEYCDMNSKDMSIYETGVLIHPLDDKYGFKYNYLEEDAIKILNRAEINIDDWEKKLFYMSISRVKNKLYVIVPKSKVSKFVKEIANHNEVMVKKEVFSVLNEGVC